MLAVSTLIEDVARYLSEFDEDESYVHWTKEDLLSYARYAIGVVGTIKKDKFIKRTEIKMKPGAVQDVPENCESNVSVIGQADENGVVRELPKKLKITKFPKLGRVKCESRVKTDSEYKLTSYEYDQTDPTRILVDPPVPDGVDATLVISCYMPPSISSDSDTITAGSELEPVIFELMLYYAFGVDIEDSSSQQRSQQHWNNAMTLLNLNISERLYAHKLALNVRGI